jgi:hypothetical protein
MVGDLSCQAGRLRLTWRIEAVDEKVTGCWTINAGGQPTLEIAWGIHRWRPVATLWIRPDFGPSDERPAREAFQTGPLDGQVVWRVTWHTWDRGGTGGENASDDDLASALESALMALLRQEWIPDLRAEEVREAMAAAHILAAGWMASRGLRTLRWSYAG